MATRIDPSGHGDLRDASQWYEGQKPGLGGEFLDKVDQVTETASVPGSRAERPKSTLETFPFAVYFLVDSGVVDIIAVLHMRRDPDTRR